MTEEELMNLRPGDVVMTPDGDKAVITFARPLHRIVRCEVEYVLEGGNPLSDHVITRLRTWDMLISKADDRASRIASKYSSESVNKRREDCGRPMITDPFPWP